MIIDFLNYHTYIFMRDKKGVNRKNWLVLIIAFTFMIFIFAPVNIYMTNQSEFWFGLKQMLLINGGACIILSIILIALERVIEKFDKVNYIFFDVVLCIYILLYIQGNYIPRNYGVLNGTDIEWDNYFGYRAISFVLVILMIVLGSIFAIKLKNKLYYVGKCITGFILMIQIVTLGVLLIQGTVSNDLNEFDGIVTQTGMFELSRDNNIIVFILDTFDGDDMKYLLEGNDAEEYMDILTDFTYYPDTLGMYPTTKASLPYILTGVQYKNEEPYVEYVKNAYRDNIRYSNLRKNGYSLGVYTSELYLNSDYTDYINMQKGEFGINNYCDFVDKWLNLVAFNYMPHQLKRFFYTDSSSFENLKSNHTTGDPYHISTIAFYNALLKNGITASETGNCFRLYHLDGVHAPATFGKDLKEIHAKNLTYYDEAAGNCEMLKCYIEALKRNGIYDKSTIIIMSDHGHINYSQNPLFAIKNVNEKHDFVISDKEMSYGYLEDVFEALISQNIVDEDFIEKCRGNKQNREFLYYNWDDAWERAYMPGMEEMYADGDADNPDNLIPTGKMYYAENEDSTYVLGSVLDFISGRTGYKYCKYGIAGNVKKEALLKFEFKEEFENLDVHLCFSDLTQTGSLKLYANEHLVSIFEYDGAQDIHFIVPHEYVKDSKLQLSMIQNWSNNIADAFNSSSLYLDQMDITSTDKEFNLIAQCSKYKYSLGECVFFDEKKHNAQEFIISGFSNFESQGTWTDSASALLGFIIEPEQYDLTLTYDCAYFQTQNIFVYANNHLLEEYVGIESETREIKISKEYIGEDGYVEIRFEIPEAISPQEVGLSTDARTLGIYLKKLKITKCVK